jgi:hypothetical protein
VIDEYGNEVQENKILTLRDKIVKNRSLIFFLISAFIFTLIILQIVPIFLVKPREDNKTTKITPTQKVVSKTERTLSSVATESDFIDLERRAATLSGQIESEDLYESSLIFPDVSTKVEIKDKSGN